VRARVGRLRRQLIRASSRGQSGNPSGRPRAVLSQALRVAIARFDPADPLARPNAQRIADKLVALAVAGNLEAIKLAFDRVEGKPRQSISLMVDQRDKYEHVIARMIEQAAAENRVMTRETAIAALSLFRPEVSELIH
jgi:hypothetical protein